MLPDINDFIERREKIAIVGLGYVGLPLAILLGSKYKVIGFDIDCGRVEALNAGYDKTGEVATEEISKADLEFTSFPGKLKEARIIIASVPTPVDGHKLPNLNLIKIASETIGQNLIKGSVVVYESTVYPGVTEEVCVPILEKNSGLKCGIDFKVGYSPERINPGDKEHTLTGVVKIVAGLDSETAELLEAIYGSIIEAGIYLAPDIRTAEAAKVIENIQRDLNIALINELALIFNKLNIDTREVLQAASTKWNFIKFEPGLVGGHCIGVDPYYLTYKAEEIGYHPTVILAGRRVNDHMGKYIAEQTVKNIIKAGKPVKGARALIAGITFKENINDIRNTKSVDIYNELKEYGIETYIFDPLASAEEAFKEYGIKLIGSIDKFSPYDAIILAVKHKQFMQYGLERLRSLTFESPVLIDVKAIYSKEEAEKAKFIYWRL